MAASGPSARGQQVVYRRRWPTPPGFQALADAKDPQSWREKLDALSGLAVEGAPGKPEDGQEALATLRGPLLKRSLGAEIWAVASGLKPTGRAILPRPEDVQRMQAWARRQGLEVMMSDLPVRSSHFVVGEDKGHPGGVLFLYGQQREALEELLVWEKVFLEEKDPDRIKAACEAHGRLLGYPPCCVKAFTDHLYHGENRDDKAYLHEQTRGEGWWPLNVISQIGPTLIGHYPCSLKCEPSLQFAMALKAHPEVARVMEDPRFERAMSGEHWYWLDRLQVWHPTGRWDLALNAQVLSESGDSLTYADPVDFYFTAAVVVPMRRAKSIREENGALVLGLDEGDLKISHPKMPCLRFKFSAP